MIITSAPHSVHPYHNAIASASQAVITKISVVLTGQGNWNQWIAVIRSAAHGKKIWEFMNPKVDKAHLPTLSVPRKPEDRNITANAIILAQLDANGKTIYRMLFQEYDCELQEFIKQE
jgi:hypothetical protein